LGAEVLPDFIERHPKASAEKEKRLASAVEAALSKITPIGAASEEPVVAYEVLWGKRDGASAASHIATARRSVEGTDLWRQHVGGFRKVDGE